MRPLFTVAFSLIFFISANSQNIDSLARAVDSSSKTFQETKEKFQQLQDSLYKQDIKRSMEQNSRNLDQFLADRKEREKKEERQLYIRIGLGVLFFAALIFNWVRRRRAKEKSKQ